MLHTVFDSSSLHDMGLSESAVNRIQQVVAWMILPFIGQMVILGKPDTPFWKLVRDLENLLVFEESH